MLALALLSACPPSIRRPESSQLTISGTLVAGGWTTRGDALADATVTLRRADTGAELATNTTSRAGGFRLAATVTANTRVLFIAQASGFAPVVRAFTVGPYTELTLGAAMTPLEPWDCIDTRCDAPFVELAWQGPPAGATGSATSFDAEEALSLDVDEARAPVLALGFATLTGDATGSFALRVPTSAWPKLIDATPGTGVIEVPVSTFDVEQAKWAALPPVPLVTEAGLPIPESALASLQRQEFAAGANALFPVASGRFLAVLGQDPTLGCVTGALKAEGVKAVGVTLGFAGFEPVASDAEGRFCIAAPVGTEVARLFGQYAGLPYSLGSVKRAAAAGTCGGSCTDVGTLDVIPAALQAGAMCRFSGRVIDTQGQPIENAVVLSLDESLTGASVEAFCGKTGAKCIRTAPSATDGTFSMVAPLQTTMWLGARATTSNAQGDAERTASQFFETCPNEPLTLKLNRGEMRLEVTASASADQLTWDPPRAASRLVVSDVTGITKWELESPLGLLPPITFGQAPSGATVLTAPNGSLGAGDSFVVEISGVGRDGVAYTGTGTATR